MKKTLKNQKPYIFSINKFLQKNNLLEITIIQILAILRVINYIAVFSKDTDWDSFIGAFIFTAMINISFYLYGFYVLIRSFIKMYNKRAFITSELLKVLVFFIDLFFVYYIINHYHF